MIAGLTVAPIVTARWPPGRRPVPRSPGNALRMFRVKICGVMTSDDAVLVAAAGADAVGLNFVAGSPRCLGAAEARAVAGALPRGVLRVGVFAGTAAEEIAALAAQVGLDAIQLHGHLAPAPSGAAEHPWEPPGICAALSPWPVIRAARLAESGPPAGALQGAREWIAAAAAAGRAPALVLVDAGSAGTAARAGAALGGTGRTVDWGRLALAASPGVPLALAGGLTPANVAAAIRATGVTAVDTASGVETAPGRKDRERVTAFVREALGAFRERHGAGPEPSPTPVWG